MYATISTKGQVTIPAPVRAALGIEPGRRVGFRLEGESVSLEVPRGVEEVRLRLQRSMKARGVAAGPYRNGDGWAAHVEAEYGQS